MSDCPYTRKEFDALTDEQRDVLQRVAVRRVPDRIFDEPADNDEPDLEICEAFNVFSPCEGCIPEDEIGDDLLQDLRHKFEAILCPATELAAEILRREGYWSESPTLDFWLVIDASFDGHSRLAVIDWDHEARPYCYFYEGHKAWCYQFDTLAELADEVLRVRDVLVDRVRDLVSREERSA